MSLASIKTQYKLDLTGIIIIIIIIISIEEGPFKEFEGRSASLASSLLCG